MLQEIDKLQATYTESIRLSVFLKGKLHILSFIFIISSTTPTSTYFQWCAPYDFDQLRVGIAYKLSINWLMMSLGTLTFLYLLYYKHRNSPLSYMLMLGQRLPFSLNFLFCFSRSWFSVNWVFPDSLCSEEKSSTAKKTLIGGVQLETASLYMERNEASPSYLTHRQGTYPAPLYLVTFWATVMWRNQMNAVSVALSRSLSRWCFKAV